MIEAANLEAEVMPAGPRGLSAYDIYIKNGGTLSEKEWLESLKGPQGEKGDTGSVKFIVVAELPTENIDTDAIYIMPTEDPSEENRYEEFIYVNNAWESLGTPNVAIDLSDYYTKEENDEKYTELKDYSDTVTGKNITGLKYSVNASLSTYNVDDVLYNLFSNATFCNAVKNTTNSGEKMGAIYIGLGNAESLQLNLIKTATYSSNPVFNVKGLWFYNNDSYIIGIEALVIKKDYSGLATVDGYNKLTLKSKIANEDILSTKQDKLTAGDNITISEDNVISASSDGKPCYVIKYTENVDFSTLNSSAYTIASVKTPIENAINDAYRKSYTYIAFHISKDEANGTENLVFNRQNANIQDKPTFIRFNTEIISNGNTRNIINDVNVRIGGTWDNDVFTISYVYFGGHPQTLATLDAVLTKTNTTSYTPTGDYNPATKKYVDDTITSAIKTSLESDY